MKLYQKLIVSNVMSSLLLTAIIVSATTYILSQGLYMQAQENQESNMRVAWSVLHQQGQQFSLENDQLLLDGQPLNQDYAVVDKIKQLVGGTATIFQFDTRISTNVIKEDGTRAIGTSLAPGEVYDTVLKQGKPFHGEADILGVRYFTAYDPIVNGEDEVIGILYVGVEKARFFNIIGELVTKSVVFAIILVVISALAIRTLTRRLLLPLNELETSMSHLAMGDADLTKRLPIINADDEIGVVSNAFNQFMNNLQNIIRDLLEHTQKTTESANQLTDISKRVATGSVKQREVVDDIVQKITHINSTIQSVANNASEAQDISKTAQYSAENGREVVAQAADSINHIAEAVRHMAATVTNLGERSDEINGIIQVIQDIAAQTNLLALNAAIEAARAGEQGRGFAVVADEVRKLAERTSLATLEIGEVIAAVQSETQTAVKHADHGEVLVKQGVELVEKAGQSLLQINAGAQQTNHVIENIAAAAAQGSDDSKEINSQIDKISQMAKDRAEISGQISHTAEQLALLSGRLKTTVDKFQV